MRLPPAVAQHLFESALTASLLLHLFVWGAARLYDFWRLRMPMPIIEVDLRAPVRPRMPWDTRLPGARKGAPAPARIASPGSAGAPKAPPSSDISANAVPSPIQEKPWILPGPNTQVIEKPVIAPPSPPPVPIGGAPGGTGPGGEGGLGGSGGGSGTGDAWVNRAPRLINLEEIRASLRRYYPESERLAGREGRVLVALIVSAQGRVQGVDVLDTAGKAFDEAAKRVALKMIFEPALVKSVPTAVRVKQLVVFQLSE